VLWGSEDRLTPADHAQAFAQAVPHAHVKLLERCGHYPQLELPTRVTRMLDEFLSERGGRVRATRNGTPRS
jgi:pimeloyl-ACP methyl ester carboxylesterase